MSRIVIALVAALVGGWIVAGSASSASAHYGPKPCNCGPLKPTFHVHVIHPTSSYTRYHDKSVFKHVTRIHPIVDITKIQPIVHINDVTRIHHRTIFYTKNTYASETIHLKPITDVRSTVVNINDGCSCRP